MDSPEIIDDGLQVGFDPSKIKGFSWRVTTSFVAFMAWILFIVIWLLFFADGYSIYRNMAAVIISLLVFLVLNAGIWVTWALRVAPQEVIRPWKGKVVVTVFLIAVWFLFVVSWLLLYAGDHSGLQNLAVLVLSLGVLVGVNYLLWDRWSQRM